MEYVYIVCDAKGFPGAVYSSRESAEAFLRRQLVDNGAGFTWDRIDADVRAVYAPNPPVSGEQRQAVAAIILAHPILHDVTG